MDLGFRRAFGVASSTPDLHLQKTVAVRIGAEAEMGAGKAVAIPQAIFHLAVDGAAQDRANAAHKPQLGGLLFRRLFRSPGAAGTTAAVDEKFTSQAIDPASSGSVHNPFPLFRKFFLRIRYPHLIAESKGKMVWFFSPSSLALPSRRLSGG
jgi:hypothetical protein